LSLPSPGAAVNTALLLLLLLLLLGARRCRVCDTRVPLLSELPTTAAYLHPNSKAYEASLSFESPPRTERYIEVFEYLPPFLLLPSFHLTPPKWKKSQETNRGSWKSHLTLSTYRRGVKQDTGNSIYNQVFSLITIFYIYPSMYVRVAAVIIHSGTFVYDQQALATARY
jgi:hypothetical protein